MSKHYATGLYIPLWYFSVIAYCELLYFGVNINFFSDQAAHKCFLSVTVKFGKGFLDTLSTICVC